MMYVFFNPNPDNKLVGDCVIRAISKLLNQSWERTYIDLVIQGYILADMPSSDNVWQTYLQRHGFNRYVIPNTCPNCYTVADFAADHPTGKYLLFVDKHVVAVENGNYYDSWDSGYRIPIYYFSQE